MQPAPFPAGDAEPLDLPQGGAWVGWLGGLSLALWAYATVLALQFV